MISLAQQLEEYKAGFMERASDETIADYERGVAFIEDSGILAGALPVGSEAPEFSLPNARGEQRSLSQLLSAGPVVLTWYRGGWCPYCNLNLRALQQHLPSFTQAGATLVAITPETPDNSLTTTEKNDLEFEVLSDAGNKVARAYGLAYRVPEYVLQHFAGKFDLADYNGNGDYELPLAATYIVSTNRSVAWRFVDRDYRKRAEPAAILAALKDRSVIGTIS